ncbi:MAG: hypothetical protein ACYC5N_03935 [Endomicrobiales bacterium]
MKRKLLLTLVGAVSLASTCLYATPSTQIWNPSTDIQAARTFHLGVDNYFSVVDNKDKPYAFGTDVGLTYGVSKNLEAGIDFLEPGADPLYFNAKLGLPESGTIPALAVGGFNFGTRTDATNYNILYGVAAKTLPPAGRFSLGYYTGNDKLLVDESGEKANSGLIATWDKALTDKIWASIDYASGKSSYGSLNYGFSYLFAPNTSVIFGYVVFNNQTLNPNNTFTTQLDINF